MFLLNQTKQIVPVAQEEISLSFVDFLWENRIKLCIYIYLVFLVVYTVLVVLNVVPDSFKAQPGQTSEASLVAALYDSASTTATVAVPQATSSVFVTPKQPGNKSASPSAYTRGGDNPVRIVIKSIGVDTPVSNPVSTKASVLDERLQHGAVRYPGSAGLGGGNVFMLAHSTGLKVVNNQAYKAFNGFRFLTGGETVVVYSLDKVYTYKVTKMRLANADDVYVDLNSTANMLTLSTCNTFGQKQERYVVEAAFVSVRALDTEAI